MKKIFKWMFFMCLFIIFAGNVSAKMLTIDEIVNGFKTSFLDQLNELITDDSGKLSASIDEENKTLDIYVGEEKVQSFKYTDEYLEYNNREAEITKENADKELSLIVFLGGIIDSVFELSGNENKTISENFVSDFDKYGLQIDSEHYKFSSDDEDGDWSLEGDFIRYLKISFDTDKINALIEKYGINLKPTLEVKDVTESTVALYPSVSGGGVNSGDELYCYIYRSKEEDGEYDIIADKVNCTDDSGFVDTDLESGTTYYYKALLEGHSEYSGVVSVTTSKTNESNSTSKTDEEVTVNPKTGIPILVICIILLVNIVMAFYHSKKSGFNNL